MLKKQEKGLSGERQASWPELGEFCPRKARSAADVQERDAKGMQKEFYRQQGPEQKEERALDTK